MAHHTEIPTSTISDRQVCKSWRRRSDTEALISDEATCVFSIVLLKDQRMLRFV